MAVFVVISLRGLPEVGAAVKRVYPSPESMDLSNDSWLVRDAATALAVSEKLGAKKEDRTIGNVVVLKLAGTYYGLASTEIWDWLKTSFEAGANG